MTYFSDSEILKTLNTLLDAVQCEIAAAAPELLTTFDLYAGEARFGRILIETDLRNLQPGAKVLEVGAGSLILSCALQREGYDTTALEPTSRGFSHFTRLQDALLDHARRDGTPPTLLRCPAEALDIDDRFAMAFSINVMEHVADIPQALKAIYRALKPGGVYRFVCPNYAFPYEAHFNLPTLFSRSLTERVFGRWIRDSKHVDDPAGTWASLNWITVGAVRRICRRDLTVEPTFRADIFSIFLDRTLSNPDFQKRRGVFIVQFIKAMRAIGALRLARVIPVAALPVMDCSIVRAPH